MPIHRLSATVALSTLGPVVGSQATGYLWTSYHRCFSDLMEQHSPDGELYANQLEPAGADVTGGNAEDTGISFMVQGAWRAIFVGGAWAFSSRARRQSTRIALGRAKSTWHRRLASLFTRAPSSVSPQKPTLCGLSPLIQDGNRYPSDPTSCSRRVVRCVTEPSPWSTSHLAPTLLQQRRRPFYGLMKAEDTYGTIDSDSDVESGIPMTKSKTEPSMSKIRPLMDADESSMQRSWALQETSPSNLSRLQVRSKHVPSLCELEEIYDGTVPQNHDGQITPALLKDVVQVLNERYSVDFQEKDAIRLHAMMKAEKDQVTRSDFSETTHSLLRAVKSAKVPLSFAQLRLIMGTAFERFDLNADGDLSLEEFSAALLSFDINIPKKQTKILLQFLSQETSVKATVLNKEDFAMEGQSSSEEQVLQAVANAQEKVADFTGWRSTLEIADKVKSICLGEGNLGEKMTRLRKTLEAEKLADSTELALTVASIFVVLLNNPAHAACAAHAQDLSEFGNQMRYMVESVPAAMTSLFQSGPMGPILLSAVLAASKAMRQQGTISLGGNEALLYVQSFQHKGCSLGFFHKLIACSEYRWGSAKPGDYLLLNSVEPELKILLHGKGKRKGVKVGAGAVLMKQAEDDKVLVEEPMTYIAWNVRKLTELIKHTKDPALVKLVRDMIQEADPGFAHFDEKASERPKNVNGLLTALSEAVQLQAKRKGLSMCYQLVDGLQRLIFNSNSSSREKICQCKALILESADDLMEGVEALSDFAGAFSALAAITSSQVGVGADFSTDDVLQLAPLFMLGSLTIGKTANSLVGVTSDSAEDVTM